MRKIFGVIWALWIGVFLFVEGIAVGNGTTGDTLSEWIWFLAEYWWVEVGLLALWSWLGYHIFIEPRRNVAGGVEG